ncbi:hypothetical protein ACHAP6_008187 [Verticillium nonalfalfae]
MGRRDASATRFQGVDAEDRIVCLSESFHRADGWVIIEVISMALGTKTNGSEMHQETRRSPVLLYMTGKAASDRT